MRVFAPWLMGTLIGLGTLGCRSPEVFQWAPDGSKLAILAEDELYVTQADGSTPRNLKLPVNSELIAAQWLPDSNRLLVAAARTTSEWNEIEKVLTPRERKQWKWAISQVKEEFANFRERQEVIRDLDEPSATLRALDGIGRYIVAKYLKLHEPEEVTPEKLGNRWTEWFSAIELFPIFSLEIWSVDETKLAVEKTLSRGVNLSIPVSISPNGRYACVLTLNHFVEDSLLVKSIPQSFDLWILSLTNDNEPRQIMANATSQPGQFTCEWSPDSQYICFSQADYPQMSSKGSLAIVDVAWIDGSLRKELTVERLVDTDHPTFAVHFLSEDRFLFAAAKQEYPRLRTKLTEDVRLYTLRLRPDPVLAELEVENAPDDFARTLRKGMFTLSPNKAKLAIMSPDGLVYVLDIDSRRLETLQGEIRYQDPSGPCLWFCRPAWRRDGALAFAVPPGSKMGSAQRPEIVLWTERGTECLSSNWPDAILRRLLLDRYKKIP